MTHTCYQKDSMRGVKSEHAFTDYLDKVGYNWRPASKEEQQNGIDVVCITLNRKYEIKHQTHSGKICVEENDGLRGDKGGWVYTSVADDIVWISNDLKKITAIKVKELRKIYCKIKNNYPLLKNKVTYGERGDKWRGSFRVIPVKDLIPYVTVKCFKLN